MNGRHASPRTGPGPGRPLGLEREQQLASVFVALADTLVEEFDLIEFLHTLVDACVEILDISAVGLMLGDDRGRLRVVASSSEETRLLELFQQQNDQGPCLECHRSGQPVHEPDLLTSAATQRWPLFAPEAADAGFRAVHALPMRLRERTVGSLNLFHVQPDALPSEVTRIAQALVDVATIGLLQSESVHRQDVLLTHLDAALDTRIVLEQAKGVLAEQHGITMSEAFTILREHGLRHDLHLTALAHAVVEREPLAARLLDADPARSSASAAPTA